MKKLKTRHLKPNRECIDRGWYVPNCGHSQFFTLKWSCYCRSIRTSQEVAANCHHNLDAREYGRSRFARGRRSGHALNNWNLERPVGKGWGRSWKDYKKCRKQWM